MAARRRCPDDGVPALHQAASRPRQRLRLSGAHDARTRLLRGLRARRGRAGVSRRPRVHDRHAVRLLGPAAQHRAAPRDVIRAGVSDRGRTVNDPSLIQVARTCAATLQFAGAVNIQCRVVDGRR